MEVEATPEEDLTGQIGAYPICGRCGSEDVVRDAWAVWNPATGLWELQQVFDHAVCETCEETTEFVWKKREEPPAESKTETIRRLNDALRIGESVDGMIVITSGIQAMGDEFVAGVAKAVAGFDTFTPENDPHGEHDFGALDLQGERVFFKVDYFDLAMTAHSSDPADPAVTRRVLTIMLASEY
jgi:hypothetical protein